MLSGATGGRQDSNQPSFAQDPFAPQSEPAHGLSLRARLAGAAVEYEPVSARNSLL